MSVRPPMLPGLRDIHGSPSHSPLGLPHCLLPIPGRQVHKLPSGEVGNAVMQTAAVASSSLLPLRSTISRERSRARRRDRGQHVTVRT
ncbi:hypothetical protein NDU88_006559 [Pleurodeles waltl]|uniref:Uncharacterized protein n=1 Tax=Pleurodeles waltl TaxID=8319 RepID=A0AAV7ULC2_PLEWA|nr:hypothetical protein NDU88_006559 [Pleurodeles waltl]